MLDASTKPDTAQTRLIGVLSPVDHVFFLFIYIFVDHVLLDRGISSSSAVCNLHFNTPISEFRGKGFSGCLCPIIDD